MEVNINTYKEILDFGDTGLKQSKSSIIPTSAVRPEIESNQEKSKDELHDGSFISNVVLKDSNGMRTDATGEPKAELSKINATKEPRSEMSRVDSTKEPRSEMSRMDSTKEPGSEIPRIDATSLARDLREGNQSVRETKESIQSSFALKHMHDLYETVAEMTAEPATKDERDVKAFFKVLRKHRMQSKVTYVLTVAGIVLLSHCVLTVKWLMPYLYSVLTPSLLFFRLIMYWKMKYQYFMLDFCYFANIYCFIYICIAPSREDMFAVGFSIASGPLIWALLIFRNSLVLHSLDKVTSLYIHLMPCLLTFVIRWYPEEASSKWHKPFPKCQFQLNFLWLVLVPMGFHVLHQVIYFILVNLILKPSSDYLNLFRYVTRKEGSLQFRLCNLFGPRYRLPMYIGWSELMVLGMLFLIPLWYNYFIANSVMLVFFCAIAAFNGATYYVDVFSLEGSEKSKCSKSDLSSIHSNKEHPPGDGNDVKPAHTIVVCSPEGVDVETKVSD